MKIINLCPYPIVFANNERIEQSGDIARVVRTVKPSEQSISSDLPYPILSVTRTSVYVGDLPFPVPDPDIIYVVTPEVANALQTRVDVLIPVAPVHGAGSEVKYQGLAIANPHIGYFAGGLDPTLDEFRNKISEFCAPTANETP